MAEPERHLPDPALIAQALPEGCLAPLFEGLAELITYRRLTQHLYHGTREALERAALGPALQALREAGVLSPCPNAGDRGITEVDVWNRWLADPEAGPDAAAQASRHAPLAKWARTEALGEIFPALREAGLEAPRGRDEDLDRPPGFAARLQPRLEARLREVFASGEIVGDPAFACRMTGDYLAFNTDGFAPVLGRITDDTRFEPVPLLEVGPPLHHLVLPMPSGVLLAADWFRLPGFKEALDALEDPDAPEITSAAGREACARAYLEGFGLGIVQTGNCAPHFWRDGEAWRVGRLDEDHEAYWDDAPDGAKTLPPQDGWVICDLWAVTFGDREVILDILDKGGAYESRDAAAEALDAYCAEHTTARIEMEPGELHLYAPRGLGRHVTQEHFRSPDLADWPGMEDMFIVSTRPLAFGDGLVVETGWRAPALSAPLEAPAP